MENEIFENKKQKNLDQFLTYKKANLGPVFDFTAYIYAVELLSGPSLALLEVIIWSKFVFSKTQIPKKHYKNRGFSPFFLEKKLRAKILEVIIWSKLAFF